MLRRFAGLYPLFLCFFVGPVQAEDPDIPTLSVTGRGEIQVEPDKAVVQVGVGKVAATAREAQERVNTTLESVLGALAELDIDAQLIQTSRLSLQAVYSNTTSRREAEEPRIVAYRASYTLSVTTLDLNQISAVIDATLGAGANQLGGLRFELEDERIARKEVLRRAVADAMDKAAVISAAAGTQLIRILEIVENGASVRPPMMTRTAYMAAEASGSPTSVMPGQVTVSGQVMIRYQISED